jgi:hypothetical protein
MPLSQVITGLPGFFQTLVSGGVLRASSPSSSGKAISSSRTPTLASGTTPAPTPTPTPTSRTDAGSEMSSLLSSSGGTGNLGDELRKKRAETYSNKWRG